MREYEADFVTSTLLETSITIIAIKKFDFDFTAESGRGKTVMNIFV